MLFLSLREGDYIMLGGNVKVSYDHSEGKDALVLGIEAPKDVQVLRGKYYEEEIAKMAAAGNEEAKMLSEKLEQEYRVRQHKYNKRRRARERSLAANGTNLKWDKIEFGDLNKDDKNMNVKYKKLAAV